MLLLPMRPFSMAFETNLDVRRSLPEFIERKQLRRAENLAVILRN